MGFMSASARLSVNVVPIDVVFIDVVSIKGSTVASGEALAVVDGSCWLPSSRKANSGSTAEGSFLSILGDRLVLKAHRDARLGAATGAFDEARKTKAFGVEVGGHGRATACLHALHTDRDGAARERYMAALLEAWVKANPMPDCVCTCKAEVTC